MNDMLKAACAVAAVLMTAGVASAQVDEGEKVYADQKCLICHSIEGTGNPQGLLDGVGSKLSAEEIREWIVDAPAMAAKTKADRKPEMPAFTSLSDDDLDALVAYLESLTKK